MFYHCNIVVTAWEWAPLRPNTMIIVTRESIPLPKFLPGIYNRKIIFQVFVVLLDRIVVLRSGA